jgi:hypothetical protein
MIKKTAHICFHWRKTHTNFCWFDVCLFVCLMVFNATFNNISVISWRSVLLMEETGVRYLEKTSDLPQVTDKLYHMMLYWAHLSWVGFELTTLVVIAQVVVNPTTIRSKHHGPSWFDLQFYYIIYVCFVF